MDALFINSFINAAIKVMETMAFVKHRVGNPYKKEGKSGIGDVSGILGITSNTSKLHG